MLYWNHDIQNKRRILNDILGFFEQKYIFNR